MGWPDRADWETARRGALTFKWAAALCWLVRLSREQAENALWLLQFVSPSSLGELFASKQEKGTRLIFRGTRSLGLRSAATTDRFPSVKATTNFDDSAEAVRQAQACKRPGRNPSGAEPPPRPRPRAGPARGRLTAGPPRAPPLRPHRPADVAPPGRAALAGGRCPIASGGTAGEERGRARWAAAGRGAVLAAGRGARGGRGVWAAGRGDARRRCCCWRCRCWRCRAGWANRRRGRSGRGPAPRSSTRTRRASSTTTRPSWARRRRGASTSSARRRARSGWGERPGRRKRAGVGLSAPGPGAAGRARGGCGRSRPPLLSCAKKGTAVLLLCPFSPLSCRALWLSFAIPVNQAETISSLAFISILSISQAAVKPAPHSFSTRDNFAQPCCYFHATVALMYCFSVLYICKKARCQLEQSFTVVTERSF